MQAQEVQGPEPAYVVTLTHADLLELINMVRGSRAVALRNARDAQPITPRLRAQYKRRWERLNGLLQRLQAAAG